MDTRSTAATAAVGPASNAVGANPTACRNCAAALVAGARYCHVCGQDTALHPPSAWEFVHEFVSHYVALEGKLWKTLALLTLRPGRLTLEFLAGRKYRYIIPLRLYLTASFLFFVSFSLLSYGDASRPDVASNAAAVKREADAALAAVKDEIAAEAASDHEAADAGLAAAQAKIDAARRALAGGGKGEGTAIAGATESSATAKPDTAIDCGDSGPGCTRLKRFLEPLIKRWKNHPELMAERLSERFEHAFSYAMFVLLPIFALLLKLAYLRRGIYYGEHLVFTLHLHSFWFIALLGLLFLPEGTHVWLLLAMIIYGIWAMQQVYGGRRVVTLLRAGAVAFGYGIALVTTTSVLGVYLVAT